MRHRRKSRNHWLTMKWLFPHSVMLRVFCILIVLISLFITTKNLYHYYELKQQETYLLQERDRLEQEKEILETKKKDLEDPEKLEQKARDELGLVKPGEVPYVR